MYAHEIKGVIRAGQHMHPEIKVLHTRPSESLIEERKGVTAKATESEAFTSATSASAEAHIDALSVLKGTCATQ